MTVAEGIEDAEQAERMRALGCMFGQGFYLRAPAVGRPDRGGERAAPGRVSAGTGGRGPAALPTPTVIEVNPA